MPHTQPAILGTGLSGLVGSRLVHDFSDVYHFENLDLSDPSNPVDITQFDQVLRAFSASDAKTVVHFAAFTDVTKAWEQRDDKNGLAYRVNVLGTENIVRAAKEAKKQLIHISTAYVFDGEKPEMYIEEDSTHPIEWYGQTKAWAEEKIAAESFTDLAWAILRIDQPFRSDSFARPDAVHRIINGLKTGKLYPQFTDHTFGPTFINDFSKVIDWVIRTQATGIFHATAGEKWSDYDFAELINQKLHLGGEVKKGNLDEYLKTLNRPYQRNTALDCSKLQSVIDFPLTPIDVAVGTVE
jgi:dTDP-4-dehydrorhamnose reductase